MAKKTRVGLFLLYSMLLFSACNVSKKISSAYYYNNESTLDSIHHSYNTLYTQKPFSLEFTDRTFNNLSIAIITDSIKYIYQFEVKEKRFADTLQKYHLNIAGIKTIITQMKSIHCTWINNLTYYENENKKMLTYISIRALTANLPFTNSKYFILTYFAQPQYFDNEGRLLAGRRLRKLRQINNEIFRRINDKVCYTISEKFR
jgi:hypothetical protein